MGIPNNPFSRVQIRALNDRVRPQVDRYIPGRRSVLGACTALALLAGPASLATANAVNTVNAGAPAANAASNKGASNKGASSEAATSESAAKATAAKAAARCLVRNTMLTEIETTLPNRAHAGWRNPPIAGTRRAAPVLPPEQTGR